MSDYATGEREKEKPRSWEEATGYPHLPDYEPRSKFWRKKRVRRYRLVEIHE